MGIYHALPSPFSTFFCSTRYPQWQWPRTVPHTSTSTSRQLLSAFSKKMPLQSVDLAPTAKLWERWREGEITDGKRGDSEQTGEQLILPWESPCTPSEDGGAAISPRPPDTTLFLFLCKYGRGRGGTESSGHSKKEPYEIRCISRTEARSWGGERGH